MFTAHDLQALVKARPFVPFRLRLSDGESIEVRHQEVVSVGRHRALIGLLDPDATDTLFDRWTIVWYMHVTRVDMLDKGSPPFAAPPGDAGAPVPA